MSPNKKLVFSVFSNKDVYSNVVEEEIMPCEITITVEFADAKRPESGNTFSPGVVMIVQSFEAMILQYVGTDNKHAVSAK